ncbi:MAG TPA: hypothetical protein VI621_08600 [Flavobacterium sp.]|nr:hypothetical protein [Flavobacterium sp.]
MFAFGCVIAFGSAIKAQEGKTIVYIPKLNTCFEAAAISTSIEGNILTLKMEEAVKVEPTKERIMSASMCQKGAVIDVKNASGTYSVSCDSSVATTCLCVGK